MALLQLQWCLTKAWSSATVSVVNLWKRNHSADQELWPNEDVP